VLSGLMEFLRVPSHQRYAGLTLDEWVRELPGRLKTDDGQLGTLIRQAFGDALLKHDHARLTLRESDMKFRDICDLARQHGNRAVRFLAMATMFAGDRSEVDRIDSLKAMLHDECKSIRCCAIICLRQIGTIAALIAILDDGNLSSMGLVGEESDLLWEVRRSGPAPEYAASLARFVRGGKGYYKNLWLAVDALADIGEAAFPHIRELLADKSLRVRQYGLGAIFRLSHAALPLIADVREMLRDEDPGIRCSAASELWRINGSKDGLSVVLSLRDHLSADVRSAAASALRDFSESEASAEAALQQLESDANEDVREIALFRKKHAEQSL